MSDEERIRRLEEGMATFASAFAELAGRRPAADLSKEAELTALSRELARMRASRAGNVPAFPSRAVNIVAGTGGSFVEDLKSAIEKRLTEPHRFSSEALYRALGFGKA